MHNLHLVVVNADTPQDACNLVEDYIQDFGDENNWRTICGCVSSKNKVYYPSNDRGRYPPDENSNTIAKINRMVKGWLNSTSIYATSAIEALKIEPDFTKWTNPHDFWSLSRYATDLYKKCDIDKKKVDVLNLNYYANQYTECGVTQADEYNGKNTYVVFVDMHD